MKIIRNILLICFTVSLVVFGTAIIRGKLTENANGPVINVEGDSLDIPCSYTKEQLLQGVTAYDEEDGELTDQIMVGDFSKFIDKGEAELTYIVFDSGNLGTVATRKIHFTDYKSPVIGLKEPLVFPFGKTFHASDIRAKITATDVLNGDISYSVGFKSMYINLDEPGTYEVTATVTNSFGDCTEQLLPVYIIRHFSNAVTFEFDSPLLYLKVGDSFSPAEHVRVITQNTYKPVEIDSDVNTSEPGVYPVHYSVSNGTDIVAETFLTVIVQE